MYCNWLTFGFRASVGRSCSYYGGRAEYQLSFNKTKTTVSYGNLYYINRYDGYCADGEYLTGKTSLVEAMPVLTFMAYRFGELHCKEAGLRVCMIIGSINFTAYGIITQTWGLAITEALFAASNMWYYLRLRKAIRVSAV